MHQSNFFRRETLVEKVKIKLKYKWQEVRAVRLDEETASAKPTKAGVFQEQQFPPFTQTKRRREKKVSVAG